MTPQVPMSSYDKIVLRVTFVAGLTVLLLTMTQPDIFARAIYWWAYPAAWLFSGTLVLCLASVFWGHRKNVNFCIVGIGILILSYPTGYMIVHFMKVAGY